LHIKIISAKDYISLSTYTLITNYSGGTLQEGEFEEVKQRIQDVENVRHIFADLEDWIERVEWESVKNKYNSLKDEFQEIYSKVNQSKTQLDLNLMELKSGNISKSQFEKKLGDLIGELSIVDLELDSIKPKLYRFMNKMKEFIQEGSMNDEKMKVLDELNEMMDISLAEKTYIKEHFKKPREKWEHNSDFDKKTIGVNIKPKNFEVLKEEHEEPVRTIKKSKKFCPKCGLPNIYEKKFCTSCGSKLF